jgi:uncharacterized protein involved in type VI secretion and phage assembly
VSEDHVGLYTGVVTDNEDPEGKCRIKAEVREVLSEPTGWCTPSIPYAGDGCGFAMVPPVGATVHVQWPRGDLSAPPVWSGATYAAGEGVEGAGPDTVIVLTPGGHRLELSDDQTALTITCSEGSRITLDGNGITIDNGQGAKLTMEGSSVDINDGALKVS